MVPSPGVAWLQLAPTPCTYYGLILRVLKGVITWKRRPSVDQSVREPMLRFVQLKTQRRFINQPISINALITLTANAVWYMSNV